MAGAPEKAVIVASILQLMESSDDSSDESSDDDDVVLIAAAFCHRERPPQRRRRNRQRQYFANVLPHFHPDEFKTFFRVSRQSAESLLHHIAEVCEEKDIKGIVETTGSGGVVQKPLEERLLVTLWFLASLDKYASIGDRFNFSESTACDSVRKLLRFMTDHLLDKLITWPSEAQQQESMDKFQDSKNFPGVIGMIDGTHVNIIKPKERGIDYYNRKDQYSVILQGVVKHDMQFIDVYTGWPGKVHDARVFRQSPLFASGVARCGADRHILGDSAYPNLEWVLTPYRDNGHLTPPKRMYNYTHASIRSVVERAFGLLKGRFKRLKCIHQYDIVTICSTIISACILHNICIRNNDDFVDALEEDVVPENPQERMEYDANLQERGNEKRDAIAAALVANR